MDTTFEEIDLMIRQSKLIPEDLQRASILVVGTGMLGSWVCEALSRIAGEVHGVDFDVVGPENIGTQAFNEQQVGAPKVLALAERLAGLPYTGHAYKFEETISPASLDLRPVENYPLVVVSAVDSFAARKMVAQWAIANKASLFIDTRAHSTIGVVCARPYDGMLQYINTLESDGVAPDPECGTEGTAFVGLWVAQQVAATLVRFFRGIPSPVKLVYDVAMSDIVLSEGGTS